jgi:hypothetical protein
VVRYVTISEAGRVVDQLRGTRDLPTPRGDLCLTVDVETYNSLKNELHNHEFACMHIFLADVRINPAEARRLYVDKFPQTLGSTTKWRLYTGTQFKNGRTALH